MTSPRSSPPPPTFRLPSARSKKRRRSNFNSELPSSDPVFSSDDFQDASIEQYEAPRKKKQHHGPWWTSSQESGPINVPQNQERSTIARNFDSGVWMGSDDSDLSLPSLPSLPDTLGSGHVQIKAIIGPVNDASGLSPAEKRAQAVIADCLENSNEWINLSQLGLEELDGSIIRELMYFSTAPPVVYNRDFRPELKLSLASYSIRSVPAEIWNLESLVSLSLRQNELSHISPSIAKLRNLKDLSITGNGLRWLPWELLSLLSPQGKLETFELEHGNQLLMPFERENNCEQIRIMTGERATTSGGPAWMPTIELLEGEQRKDPFADEVFSQTKMGQWFAELRKRFEIYDPAATPWMPIFMGSTHISFYNPDGSLASGTSKSACATSPDQEYIEAYLQEDLPLPSTGRSKLVPSLFELSLERAASLLPATQLREYLPTYGAVSDVLTEVESSQSDGDRNCSVCGRAYIVPRAEWMEYWHRGHRQTLFNIREVFVPFVRRACSWHCAEMAYQRNSTRKPGEPV